MQPTPSCGVGLSRSKYPACIKIRRKKGDFRYGEKKLGHCILVLLPEIRIVSNSCELAYPMKRVRCVSAALHRYYLELEMGSVLRRDAHGPDHLDLILAHIGLELVYILGLWTGHVPNFETDFLMGRAWP